VIDGFRDVEECILTYTDGVETKREPQGYHRFYHCNMGWGDQADGYYWAGVFGAKPVLREEGLDKGSDGSNIYNIGYTIIQPYC
jgi:hypothetical protein